MVDPLAINLAKNRRPHFLDQFIGWALTVGRFLVIVTETVALSAFLLRFGLDREIIDLHDKITQEQNVVNFLKKEESKFRNLQDRLTLATSIIGSENKTRSLYQDISRAIGEDTTLESFTFSQNRIIVQLSSHTLTSLSSFTSQLKNYPTVATVSVDKIEEKTTSGEIRITITAELKKDTNILL